jgi:hypothetical protein
LTPVPFNKERQIKMTIGTVLTNTDNAVISSMPALRQPDGSVSFSDALNKSKALSSGSADLDAIFNAAGQRYNIPPNLLKAVAKAESNFRPDAVSTAGAMGIMQLMPGTASGLGVTDAFDPEQNIMGGAKYLRQMLDRFGGDLQLALGAYNAGPGNVAKYGGVPSFSQNYVSKVIGYYDGGDITAGTASLGIAGVSSQSGKSSDKAAFNEALTQMIFMKLLEMQMSSSDDSKHKVF